MTDVPETRWVKNSDQQRFFYEETFEHYDEHAAEILTFIGS